MQKDMRKHALRGGKLADTSRWSNIRSFVPYENLKGKMYAEYTNVGNANGLPVTMRIWFLDWQNTDISGYPGYEDVDNVVVSVDNTKRRCNSCH